MPIDYLRCKSAARVRASTIKEPKDVIREGRVGRFSSGAEAPLCLILNVGAEAPTPFKTEARIPEVGSFVRRRGPAAIGGGHRCLLVGVQAGMPVPLGGQWLIWPRQRRWFGVRGRWSWLQSVGLPWRCRSGRLGRGALGLVGGGSL